MATYTPEQYGELLEKFARGLPKHIAIGHLKAAQQTRADIPGRVFNKGEAVDGTDIGSYSTAPMLVGAKSFPTKGAAAKVFGSKKKRSDLEWRRIGKANLAILDGGYKELRRISDLRTDKVDLEVQGDLRRSIKLLKVGDEWQLRIFGSKQIIKARANEKRFKNKERSIFAHSKKEEDRAQQAFNTEISKYIKSFFS